MRFKQLKGSYRVSESWCTVLHVDDLCVGKSPCQALTATCGLGLLSGAEGGGSCVSWSHAQSSRLISGVCVCLCARACVCVCACVCSRAPLTPYHLVCSVALRLSLPPLGRNCGVSSQPWGRREPWGLSFCHMYWVCLAECPLVQRWPWGSPPSPVPPVQCWLWGSPPSPFPPPGAVLVPRDTVDTQAWEHVSPGLSPLVAEIPAA